MNDETIKDKMINYFDSQGINWKLQNAMTIFKGGIEQGKSEAIKLINKMLSYSCSSADEDAYKSYEGWIEALEELKQSLTSQPHTKEEAEE